MSLLQDVLRQQLEVVEDQRRTGQAVPSLALLSPPDSDDDETIDVVSFLALCFPKKDVTN